MNKKEWALSKILLLEKETKKLEKKRKRQIKRQEPYFTTDCKLAANYHNLAFNHVKLKQFEQALEYGIKAVETQEQVFKGHRNSLAVSYAQLSRIYKHIGQTDKALEFRNKIKQIKQ